MEGVKIAKGAVEIMIREFEIKKEKIVKLMRKTTKEIDELEKEINILKGKKNKKWEDKHKLDKEFAEITIELESFKKML